MEEGNHELLRNSFHHSREWLLLSRVRCWKCRVPIPMKSGKAMKYDYEYERKGTCCVFIVCETLTGWRYVEVRKRRTKVDYAQFMEKVSGMFPGAETLRVVQDNLNTHTYGSFYENFDAEKARRLKNLFEFHYTPKHASWLSMAEIDLSALSRQCLDRRIGDAETLEEHYPRIKEIVVLCLGEDSEPDST